MIQKKYLCKDYSAAEESIGQIADMIQKTPHKTALLTFYEKGFTKQEIDTLIGRLKGYGFPELKIAGLSIAIVVELMPEGTGVLFNLVLTDEADISVVPIPCMPGGELAAAEKFKNYLDSQENVKAVELFGSNMHLNFTSFMENAMKGHEEVPLFGTCTIRNLMKKISTDESGENVDVQKIDADSISDEFAYSDEVLYDGIVLVVFAGENLKVKANYALGWKPIGRRFPIELSEKSPMGESELISINNAPPVDIYKEYLGVYPDSFMTSNVCSFPFIVERNGMNICTIPLDHDDKGNLYCMMTLHPDEQIRFSFATHDEVLNASYESLVSMSEFHPEALFLTLCGNRISTLQEDAYHEWDGFGKIAPDFAIMHGVGELYYHHGQGGILNSAHLAIGMRESDNVSSDTVFEPRSVDSFRHERTIPLADRMSTFLGRVTTDLIESARQAKKANNAKSAFLSHMSHEIRTPISAILGMDEMILKECNDNDILDYAENIHSAGNNLLGIVNDILDFSKIEAGKMSIVPTEYQIKSLINDMYNVVRLRAEAKGLSIVLDIDPDLPSVLYGDSARLKQIITNILTNAVKYTETGTVTLKIKKIADGTSADEDELSQACAGEKLPEKSVRLNISVKDTGIGIRPEDLKKLFKEYERFDEKRNQMIEGTGLGMSITKELLDLMGSHINVESTYGVGSEFGFEIMQGVISSEPVGEMEGNLKKHISKKKIISFTAEDARILVVDDAKMNLLLITKLLKDTKINIDTATSGEEALNMVAENAYDVILLDHMMPDITGPETLKRMREMSNNLSADAPVISLTANASDNAKEEYVKMGFKNYLSKPFRPEDLIDMLSYYIPPEKIRTVTADTH